MRGQLVGDVVRIVDRDFEEAGLQPAGPATMDDGVRRGDRYHDHAREDP